MVKIYASMVQEIIMSFFHENQTKKGIDDVPKKHLYNRDCDNLRISAPKLTFGIQTMLRQNFLPYIANTGLLYSSSWRITAGFWSHKTHT